MKAVAKSRLATFGGMLGVGLLAMFVSPNAAAKPPVGTPVWTGGKGADCTVRDVQLPVADATQFQRIADACDAASRNSRSSQDDAANASYNAARAHNALAQLSSGATALSHYVAAVGAVKRSLDRVGNDDPAIAQATGDRANLRFGFGRPMELARAYVGLGLSDPAALSQLDPRPCADHEACLTQAIDLLTAAQERTMAGQVDRLDPYDTRYDEFVFLRGRAYAGLDRDTERDHAIDDFEEVSRRAALPNTPPARFKIAADAQRKLADITLSAGRIALATKTRASQSSAAISFQKALSADPTNVDAGLGLGSAYLWLGNDPSVKDGRQDNYARAGDAYAEAARRANAAKRSADEASAHDGHAQAIQGLISLDPRGPDAANRRRQVVTEYLAASTLEGSAERRMKLAAAYRDAGQPQQAMDQYQQVALLSQEQGSLASRAFLELAAIAKAQGSPSDELRYYQKAIDADRSSARPFVEIGKGLYQSRSFDQAKDRLEQGLAIAGRSAIDDGSLAEAQLYLSKVITESNSASEPDLKRAVDMADQAAIHGAAGTRSAAADFAEQPCLARIRRGKADKADVQLDDASGHCMNVPTDKVGGKFLLRGMYFLRRAQFLGASSETKARDALSNAIIAFEDGVGASTTTAANAESATDLLRTGGAIARYCIGLNRNAAVRDSIADLTSDRIERATTYFTRYHVLDCAPERKAD